MFVGDKKEFSLEMAMVVPIKARDRFPLIQKKVGTMMNLEATRPIAVAITGSEEEALAFRKRAPSQKGKGKVLPHQTLSKKSRRIQKKGGSLSHLTK